MNTILFLVKDENRLSIKDSLDFPGLKISFSWRIGKNRIKSGDRVGFTDSWTKSTHSQGIVIMIVPLSNGRSAIYFEPDNLTINCNSVTIKNKHTEKNYL